MRLVLAAALAASMWAAEARAQFEPVRNRREIHATAPFIFEEQFICDQLQCFSLGFEYPDRAFQAELVVEIDGARQAPITFITGGDVEYDVAFNRRGSIFDLDVGMVAAAGGEFSYAERMYGNIRFSSYFGASLDGFGFSMQFTSVGPVSLYDNQYAYPGIEYPETWDEPATVDRISRLGSVSNDGQRLITWELDNLDGPYHETDLLLVDRDIATGLTETTNLRITLDRFGWLPVDELIVGAPRRGIQPAMAAAVPEPGSAMLLLICAIAFLRLRPPARP